jgi:hypothetical protein
MSSHVSYTTPRANRRGTQRARARASPLPLARTQMTQKPVTLDDVLFKRAPNPYTFSAFAAPCPAHG